MKPTIRYILPLDVREGDLIQVTEKRGDVRINVIGVVANIMLHNRTLQLSAASGEALGFFNLTPNSYRPKIILIKRKPTPLEQPTLENFEKLLELSTEQSTI